ncbi:MAG: Eco57I restriction-modification methylase domain-containing protein [Bacteroidetes bacterium]|nr:Eco57I restriction-modification methylase domain-containing protein [Bacteroidota bacterium]
MEGETASSVKQQITIHHTRVLPDLDKNIVSGNSLIGYDFTDGELELDKEQRKEIQRQINPFEWKVAFPQIFRQGKFDVVIGNPPYVNLVNIEQAQRDYFQKTFKTCKNKSDLYSFFIEKSLDLIKSENSKFGFIIPHTWLATESFELFRKLLIDKGFIEEISEMGFKVFEDAIVSTVVLICSNNNSSITIKNRNFIQKVKVPYKVIKANNYIIDLDWSLVKQKLYDKIEENTVHLEKIISFSRGIKTSDDTRFVLASKKNSDCFKIYRGRNIKAHQINWDKEWIWYRPDLMKQKVGCLPHSKQFFEVPEKLVTQRVNSSMQLLVAYDAAKNYFLDTVNVSRYSSWDKKHSLKFICGLLNSKLINYWYCNKYKMPTIGLYELHSVPVHPIDFENKNDKKIHDDIVKLVDTLISKNQEIKSISQSDEISNFKNKISYNQSNIDDLVYQLYNLTAEEISIIEQSNEGS